MNIVWSLVAIIGALTAALALSKSEPERSQPGTNLAESGGPPQGRPDPASHPSSPAVPGKLRLMGPGLEAGRSDGWAARVIESVAGSESRGAGGHAALNKNWDSCGLSVGLIQWAQCAGSLGILLQAQRDADPRRFEAIYGGPVCAKALLDVTQAKARPARIAPVCGTVLWEEPWLKRFQLAGSDPVFKKVQDDLALSGEHFQGALGAAEIMTGGWVTERMMALLYDRSVQQGPSHVKKHAAKVLASLKPSGESVTYQTLLNTYADTVHGHFRRTLPPNSTSYNKRLEWRGVGGGEWHVFTKPTERSSGVDLYARISARSQRILENPALRDVVFEV